MDNNIEYIRWFLKLANLEVSNLSEGERLKWTTEAVYMLEFGDSDVKRRMYPAKDRMTTPEKILSWAEGDNFEKCQVAIKQFLENLMNNIENTVEEKRGWKPNHRFNFDNSFYNLKTEVEVTIQVKIMTGLKMESRDDGKGKLVSYYRVDPEEMYDAPLHVSLNTVSDEESLILTLCQNLEGIKIKSIRTCAACRKWFLHTSRKQKSYCSNRCAARRGSKIRRDRIKTEDPEKYKAELIAGRERADKSYEKKVYPAKVQHRTPKEKKSGEE